MDTLAASPAPRAPGPGPAGLTGLTGLTGPVGPAAAVLARHRADGSGHRRVVGLALDASGAVTWEGVAEDLPDPDDEEGWAWLLWPLVVAHGGAVPLLVALLDEEPGTIDRDLARLGTAAGQACGDAGRPLEGVWVVPAEGPPRRLAAPGVPTTPPLARESGVEPVRHPPGAGVRDSA